VVETIEVPLGLRVVVVADEWMCPAQAVAAMVNAAAVGRATAARTNRLESCCVCIEEVRLHLRRTGNRRPAAVTLTR
jgi:hypothetical protein